MWQLFNWWSEYRLKRLQIKLDATNRPYEILASAVASQADMVTRYFDSFKTTEIPTSHTIRDEDEYNAEIERSGGKLNPGVSQSIKNAIRAGSFPELKDILTS